MICLTFSGQFFQVGTAGWTEVIGDEEVFAEW